MLNGCNVLKTKELATQSFQLPAPQFLVFSNTEEGKDLSKVFPFLINKAITGRAGFIASIQKCQNKTLLVETTSSQKQSFITTVLKMTLFF